MTPPKKRIIFRLFDFNRLSFPILLNVWEQHGIDTRFEIVIRERPLSAAPVQPISPGDVVLYSFMTPHLPIIHEEIRQIKHTGALIVGGGPHISGELELAFRMGFDIIFTGAAEKNFLTFGRQLLENSVGKQTIYKADVSGVRGSSSPEALQLNRYLPVSRYIKGIPPLEIMRGCHWNCNYCATGLRRVIPRDLESVEAYLKAVRDRAFKRITYICPSSLEYKAPRGRKLNLEKIEEVLALTKSYGFPFIEMGIFPSEIRPDTVSSAGISLLKKYVSHKSVTLGAQSGCNERLRKLRRAHTVEDIESATAIINDCGFMANLDFIVAYPGETRDERLLTLEFIRGMSKNYRIKTHLHHFFPLSGTPYGFQFPSFLSNSEKEELLDLRRGGISRDGWVENEKQAVAYFQWLKENFPDYYARYSG
ncbi:MAG: TIGR04013 family B12-binding domain/radical SAM domain-containing protein [bacterium]|nr:TIGR04013 family B12-binding domain/radical SAM domain-containing protein [bacterium]